MGEGSGTRVPRVGCGEPAVGLPVGLRRSGGPSEQRASARVGRAHGPPQVPPQRGGGGCNLVWSPGFRSVSKMKVRSSPPVLRMLPWLPVQVEKSQSLCSGRQRPVLLTPAAPLTLPPVSLPCSLGSSHTLMAPLPAKLFPPRLAKFLLERPSLAILFKIAWPPPLTPYSPSWFNYYFFTTLITTLYAK